MTKTRGPAVIGAVAGLAAVLLVAQPAAADDGDTRAGGPHAEAWWYDSLRLGEVHKQATGQGVTIAVIDSGLNLDVPELQGADVRMMRSSCLAGRRAPSTADRDALHGTRVVSMLVGNGDGAAGPGTGIMGVAPDATILFFDNDDGSRQSFENRLTCNDADLPRLTRRAARMADIVSMSYAGSESLFATAILPGVVRSNQAVLVAGAQSSGVDLGFNDELDYAVPASIPGIVSVGAYDRALKPWSESQSRFAPQDEADQIHDGQRLFFPVVSGPGVDVKGPGSSDVTFQTVSGTGTSFATPTVSGSLALVKQKYPDATPNQLVQHLIHYTGAQKMNWYKNFGFGNVFPRKMLAHDPTLWPDENPLLDGPYEAVRKYPRGSDTAPESPPAEPGEAATGAPEEDPSKPAAAAEAPQSDKADETAVSASGGQGGPPVWTWPAGGVALLGVAAAGWWGFRRRRVGQHVEA